jgi:hypothetical protein
MKVLLIVLIFTQIGWLRANANELYFIDAHSQVDHNLVPLNKIISLMDNAGVRQTILSTRGNLKGKTLLKLSKENPGRVTPAVRTKVRPYDTGSKKYYELLKKQIATNQYRAIAEVLLYHAKKGNKAPSDCAWERRASLGDSTKQLNLHSEHFKPTLVSRTACRKRYRCLLFKKEGRGLNCCAFRFFALD